MDKEILALIRKITNDFTKNWESATLMGHDQVFDEQGREVSVDPNYFDFYADICGVKYWFVRKDWIVKFWDTQADYLTFMNNIKPPILILNIKPQYVKEFEFKHRNKN